MVRLVGSDDTGVVVISALHFIDLLKCMAVKLVNFYFYGLKFTKGLYNKCNKFGTYWEKSVKLVKFAYLP
jgi:hypothetical protein